MGFELFCATLIALFLGAVILFGGYRLFLILLPIWGFFFGFGLGAHTVTLLFGQEFFATVTSWVVGFVVGVPDIIFALVIGILSGGIVAILFLFVQGLIRKKYSAFTAIPYGPFLILGGAVMLYYGKEFMTWYSTR